MAILSNLTDLNHTEKYSKLSNNSSVLYHLYDTLSKQKNYLQVSNDILEHIVSCRTLDAANKLYYLFVYFADLMQAAVANKANSCHNKIISSNGFTNSINSLSASAANAIDIISNHHVNHVHDDGDDIGSDSGISSDDNANSHHNNRHISHSNNQQHSRVRSSYTRYHSNQRSAAFSADRIAKMMRWSASKVFRIQKHLESLQYLLVVRSFDQRGANQVNSITTTLPEAVFLQLFSRAPNRYHVSNSNSASNPAHLNLQPELITPAMRCKSLTQLKLFIPINYRLAKFVLAHSLLSDQAKLIYFSLFAFLHKVKLKHNYQAYAGSIDLASLARMNAVSKSTLRRCLDQLAEAMLIRRSAWKYAARDLDLNPNTSYHDTSCNTPSHSNSNSTTTIVTDNIYDSNRCVSSRYINGNSDNTNDYHNDAISSSNNFNSNSSYSHNTSNSSNRFDLALHYFELLIPEQLTDVLLPISTSNNSFASSNNTSNNTSKTAIGSNAMTAKPPLSTQNSPSTNSTHVQADAATTKNIDSNINSNVSIKAASLATKFSLPLCHRWTLPVSQMDPPILLNKCISHKLSKKLDKKIFSNLEGLGIDEVENKLVSKNRGASEDQARSNMLSLLLVKGNEKTRAAEQRRKEEEVEESSKPTSTAKMGREEIAIEVKKVTTKTRCERQREELATGNMGDAEIDIGHRDVLRRFEMVETEKMIEGTWKEEVATKTGSMALIEGNGQKTLKKVSEVIKKVIEEPTKPESECQEERVGGSYGYTNFNVGNVGSNTRNNKANKNSDKDMSKKNKEVEKAAAKNRKVLEKATENKVGKSLGEYYPLRESQIEELKRRSGRGFSPRVINELLLHMSKKYRSYRFKRESNMLSYMSKVLRKEQREESEVNKENYMIKSNYSQEEYKRRCEEYVKVERYFSAIEQEAIVNRSEEGQLRAKLVNMLPREVGYELVRNIEEVRIKQLGLREVKEVGAEGQRVVGDKPIAEAGGEEREGIEGVVGYRELEGIWEVMRAELVMREKVELGEYYQRRVIEQIEAVYGVVIKDVRQIASQEAFKARVERIRGDKIVRNSQASRERDYGKEKQGEALGQEKKAGELKLPENVWGKMRGEIIAEYGEATDRGWFSKLEEVIDEESKEIRLLTPNGFYRDYVEREYSQELNRLRRKYGYKIELVYVG